MDETKQFLMKQKEHLDRGKRGILSIIFGRTGILILLIILQCGFIFLGFKFLSEYIYAVFGGYLLLGFVLAVYVINKRINPAFKIVWIVMILIVPVFGALFYLYIHLQTERRAFNKKILREMEESDHYSEQKCEVMEKLRQESPAMANLAGYLRKTGSSSVHRDTSVRYFPSGESAFDTIISELQSAKEFIFLEYFIVNQGYMWESMLEVLKEKVKEGVEVRVMYDGMCDYFALPRHYAASLREYGIQCYVFSPILPMLSTVQNNRDHRKILVIDGHTAFTGGINLADEYINRKERFGYWKDVCMMMRGEAVRDFTLMFLQMWNVVDGVNLKKRGLRQDAASKNEEYERYIRVPMPETGEDSDSLGYVIPYGDNPLDEEQIGEMVYLDIINTAKKYVHIMTPYLVLDQETKVALIYAAKRGVDVRIIMPHVPDKKYAFIIARSFYNELIEAGVEIYEFLPGFVHAKVFASDDEKAVVGSINLDFRSLYLNFECAALMYRNKEIAAIEEDFRETLTHCMRVTEEVYKKQNLFVKMAAKLLHLFAPLM